MINYKLLDESIKFYECRGFKRIESPWAVTKDIASITAPEKSTFFSITEKNKVLVASGEQSFLYLYNKGFLPRGRFQTITPCFRDDSFDETHTKYFIKNELIITDKVNDVILGDLVDDAKDFANRYKKKGQKLEIVKTGDDSFDLVCDGIEIGSYGIRKCSYLKWIYGTGIAEPRFSRVLKA